METQLLPKTRQMGMCMTMLTQERILYAAEQHLKRILANKKITSFEETQVGIWEQCAIAKNNLKPLHEREIMAHMSIKDIFGKTNEVFARPF